MNVMPSDTPAGVPYRGIQGIEAWRLDARLADVHVTISRERPPLATAAVEQEWSRLVAGNPRLHDGGVLSVLSFDQDHHAILARRDSYKRLAVQPRVHTGVRLLGVTALLEAIDGSGRRHVLLGRRGVQTRLYGGQWEIGPSGGVSLPPLNIERLSLADLCASLHDEISEETGLTAPVAGTPAAYVRDHFACSDDLVIAFSLGELDAVRHLARPANWEYQETHWMPLDCASQFDTPETIGASRALFRLLDWLPMH